MGQNGCSRSEKGKRGKEGGLFSRQASHALRGLAILMVMASHYGEWYAGAIGLPALSQLLMGLGRYGVDIFFLMSGYGLAKSASVKRPGCAFWIRRLRSTYLPYLILAGIIEICAGGVYSAGRIVNYLLAQEYWFIFNIMVFYLAFFLCFQAKRFRIAALSFMTAAFSAWLSGMGRQDFWYVSNLAFPLGAALGLYEKRVLEWGRKNRLPAAAFGILLSILCVFLIPAAMKERTLLLQTGGRGRLQLLSITLFALWIGMLFCLKGWGDERKKLPETAGAPGRAVCRFLGFFGKNSLYLYLLHAFLYYQVVNRLSLGTPGGFAAALGSAVLGAGLFSLLWEWLWKWVDRAAPQRRRGG